MDQKEPESLHLPRKYPRQHHIYSPKDETETVLKGGAIWFNGQDYERRYLADDPDRDLRREARIYEALGPHDRITKCLGLQLRDRGDGTQEAWALRLERAPLGCIREYLLYGAPSAPDMRTRLRMCVDFAEGMEHVHGCGVLWGDVSTHNALLFDGLRVRLCDFAGSTLEGVYDKIRYGYDLRYIPPGEKNTCPDWGTLEREIYALGTTICEITEWEVPYGKVEEEEVCKALGRGESPKLAAENPAGEIVRQCWAFGYGSVREVVDALKTVLSLH